MWCFPPAQPIASLLLACRRGQEPAAKKTWSSLMTSLDAVLDRIDREMDQSVGRLFEFLRIPSIPTDPDYKDHSRLAAEYVAKNLSSLGLETSIRPTGGHPIV